MDFFYFTLLKKLLIFLYTKAFGFRQNERLYKIRTHKGEGGGGGVKLNTKYFTPMNIKFK